jgi:hypothetical protein
MTRKHVSWNLFKKTCVVRLSSQPFIVTDNTPFLDRPTGASCLCRSFYDNVDLCNVYYRTGNFDAIVAWKNLEKSYANVSFELSENWVKTEAEDWLREEDFESPGENETLRNIISTIPYL